MLHYPCTDILTTGKEIKHVEYRERSITIRCHPFVSALMSAQILHNAHRGEEL